MANYCGFELHARAKILNENALIEMKRKFGFGSNGFSTEETEDSFYFLNAHLDEYKLKDGYYVLHICGDCKWAVNGPLLQQLDKFAKMHTLDMEIYSEESGVGFQEHYQWENGERVVKECKDMLEFNIDDIMDDEDGEFDYIFQNKLCQEVLCTKDNYQSFADDDGYIRLGGFSNWDFEF